MGERGRVVVLISGSGSNLQALIDASAEKELDGDIVLVVSNRHRAVGLTRAQTAGIETAYFPLKPYRVAADGAPPAIYRAHYDADLAALVAGYEPDVVVLAGWMHILSPAFLDRFPRKVINLHPALPGQFAGTHAIERTYEAFQRGEVDAGGCMVHFAIPEVDAGQVIASEVVPLDSADTLDSFAARIHAAEHRIIVQATQAVLRQGA